jgi:hypothetical protein
VGGGSLEWLKMERTSILYFNFSGKITVLKEKGGIIYLIITQGRFVSILKLEGVSVVI